MKTPQEWNDSRRALAEIEEQDNKRQALILIGLKSENGALRTQVDILKRALWIIEEQLPVDGLTLTDVSNAMIRSIISDTQIALMVIGERHSGDTMVRMRAINDVNTAKDSEVKS